MKHSYNFYNIGIALLLLLASCGTPKPTFVGNTSDSKTSAIYKAIELFTKTKPKIYDNDSVFYISYTDSLFKLAFTSAPQPNKDRITHVWKRDTYYADLGAVTLLGSSDYQYFLTSDIQVGRMAKVIPTRFIEIEGKLFLWDDENYPVTEELLSKFHHYNLFLEDTGALMPDNPMDDSKKGFTYLFCKNNLNNYKIIISNKALGYSTIPNITCNK